MGLLISFVSFLSGTIVNRREASDDAELPSYPHYPHICIMNLDACIALV